MTEQQYVIDLGTDGRAIVEADEKTWLDDKIRREPGPMRLRFRADDNDTEGHGQSTTVSVLVGDEDDTEGHAIALHFPTIDQADAFRRRLLLTGVLVGTVALGAASGVGLANLSSDAGSAGAAQSGQYVAENMGGTIAATQAGPMDAHEAPAFQASSEATGSAWTQDERAGLSPASAETPAGPMDAHEAPAFQSGSNAATDDGEIEQIGGPQPR
jgi:hypothetical protein